MVKIPGFDELKKMGSDFVDSAKSVKLGEMVDRVKSGIDAMGVKKGPNEPIGDETLKNAFQNIYASLNELTQAQAAQLAAIKKIESQLGQLAIMVETYRKEGKNT